MPILDDPATPGFMRMRPYGVGPGRRRKVVSCDADNRPLLERLRTLEDPAATMARLPELIDRYGTGPALIAALAPAPCPADPAPYDDVEFLGGGTVALVPALAGPGAELPTIQIPRITAPRRQRLADAGVPLALRFGSTRLHIAALRVSARNG